MFYIQIRDSFESRFGDDLYELIASYLTIGDKFRYECLSKRFQRLVFGGQHSVVIKYRAKAHEWDAIDKRLLIFRGGHKLIVNRFVRLIRKCHRLQSLTIFGKIGNIDIIMAKIIKYCPHLTSIGLQLIGCCPSLLMQFDQTFGHRLRAIVFNPMKPSDDYTADARHLLPICQNVRTISNVKLDTLVPLVSKLSAYKSLQRIDNLFVDNAIDDQLLDTFVAKISPTLKSLDIHYGVKFDHKICIEILSQFKSLRVLSVYIKCFDTQSAIWIKTVANIGKNCPQLLSLSLKVDDTNLSEVQHCFAGLQSGYYGLKQLVLSFNRPVAKWDTNYALNCLGLQTLKLQFPVQTNHQFMANSHRWAPRLRHLEMVCVDVVTDYMMSSLAKHRKLRSVCLRIMKETSFSMYSLGVKSVQSLRIQNILFNYFQIECDSGFLYYNQFCLQFQHLYGFVDCRKTKRLVKLVFN